jgi:hypothetical protein
MERIRKPLLYPLSYGDNRFTEKLPPATAAKWSEFERSSTAGAR